MKEQIKQYLKDNPSADHFDVAMQFKITLIEARLIVIEIGE